jgi:hypothetical protein
MRVSKKGRQDRDGNNVLRTASSGLIAYRRDSIWVRGKAVPGLGAASKNFMRSSINSATAAALMLVP